MLKYSLRQEERNVYYQMPRNPHKLQFLSIGQLSARTGLAASAIRFYETKGLVHSERNAAGQRRFLRADIRRLSFVMVAQRLGFTIARIRTELDALPKRRVPGTADWSKISEGFRGRAGSTDRNHDPSARQSRWLHRLRLFVDGQMRALEPRRPGSASWGWAPVPRRGSPRRRPANPLRRVFTAHLPPDLMPAPASPHALP